MTRAVITMAHSLQMRVLAEGVETESQVALLKAHRCDAIQGFVFSKPVSAAEVSEMAGAGKRLPECLVNRPPRQRTLLLVDDEEHIVAALKRSLRRGGYRILTAFSAAEGLQRLAETDVDVIVSDQRMPVMTGVEFLRRAKDLYPHTMRIVLSGYTELQSITDAINEGAIYKFLTKPWDDELLRANIEEAFRQKELSDENMRLDQEVRTANTELAEVNQRLQEALARQKEQLTLTEDVGRSALALLNDLPIALIGLEPDNAIVFANLEADRLIPGVCQWICADAGTTLPEPLARLVEMSDQSELDVVVDERLAHCVCRVSRAPDGQERRLVTILPREAIAAREQ